MGRWVEGAQLDRKRSGEILSVWDGGVLVSGRAVDWKNVPVEWMSTMVGRLRMASYEF